MIIPRAVQAQYTHACICMYVYIYIYIFICVYMYVCMYVCMYIYIYTHTHVCIYPAHARRAMVLHPAVRARRAQKHRDPHASVCACARACAVHAVRNETPIFAHRYCVILYDITWYHVYLCIYDMYKLINQAASNFRRTSGTRTHWVALQFTKTNSCCAFETCSCSFVTSDKYM